MPSVRIEVESYHLGNFQFEEEESMMPRIGGLPDDEARNAIAKLLDHAVERARSAYGVESS